MVLRNLFIGTCMFLISLSVSAQKIIKGIIKDKNTEEPVSFVAIQLSEVEGANSGNKPGHQHKYRHNHTAGTTTGESGEFEFQNLHDGVYLLKITGMGYLPAERIVEVKGGKSEYSSIFLEERVFQTQEVVVSANRNEVDRRLAPVVVNVLNTKTFETVNSCDLAKSLNYQSGLRVENNCQNCGFPQVRINGLDGPYSQILIDSRPVLSALGGVYGLEQIPVNMIDRVEIVRGGGSALFGSNAVAGTINIITKDPVDNSFQVSSTFSALGGKAPESVVNANASLVTKENKAGISLYQSYRNRHSLDIDGDGFSEIGKIESRNFGFRGYVRPSDMGRLSLEYHTSDEFRRGGDLINLPPHEANIAEQTDHSINGGGITYDHYFSDYKHKISVYGSIQNIDRKSYYGAGKDPDAYGTTSDLTWVTGATYVAQINKFLFSPATFTAGIEYQENRLHDKMVSYNRDLKQDVRIGSGFLQNEWNGDLFSLLVGARLDKHNLIDHLIFSPRVNLLYKPSEHVQGRLTFSTGFRAPQAYDEDLHVAAVGGKGMVIKLAPGLKEEKSLSYSGSVDLYKDWNLWQANLLLELFYTDLKNVFVLNPVGDDPDSGYTIQKRGNGKGARVYGANVDAKLAYANKLQWQLGFTWQQSRYKEAFAWSETADPVKRMLRTPDCYGYLTLTYNVWKALQAAVSGTYTGKMYLPHFAGYIPEDRLERSSDFYDMNLKLSYDFKWRKNLTFQINGGIQNIFDSRQKDFDRGENRDSKYFYGPAQPRSYFLGFKIGNI